MEDIEAQRALNARQRAMSAEQIRLNDPNTLANYLSRFDGSSSVFGSGVADKTRAANREYQGMQQAALKQEQEQLTGLRGLQDAYDTGTIGDVKSRYTLGDGERKHAETLQDKALGHAVTYQGNKNTTDARVEAAQLAAEVGMLRNAAKSKDDFVALMNSKIKIEMAELVQFKGKSFLNPADTAEKKRIEARIEVLRNAMDSHDPRLAAGAPPAQGNTMAPPPGAVKLKKG
jgi:hypothetical protein